MRKILELSNENFVAIENATIEFGGTMAEVKVVDEIPADDMSNSEFTEISQHPERFKITQKGQKKVVERKAGKKGAPNGN